MPSRRPAPFVSLVFLLGLTLLFACSPSENGVSQGQTGDPVIVLSEGACEGTCPIYDMTLHADGSYILNGVNYVRRFGVTEGSLGPEAWGKAEAILSDANFWTLRQIQTSKTLATCQSGTPVIRITWRTVEGKEKTLTYDAGCGVQKVQQLVVELREALNFDGLVWTDQKFMPPS